MLKNERITVANVSKLVQFGTIDLHNLDNLKLENICNEKLFLELEDLNIVCVCFACFPPNGRNE